MPHTDTRHGTLDRVLEYLAATVPAALGPGCRSVYLTGSAVLGHLHPVVQDVDLLFLVDAPLATDRLHKLRECLEATRLAHEDEATRIVWRVIAGPWKPEPAEGRWTIALHGNLMTRAQFAKFISHHSNIAATMFEKGRTLVGEDPTALGTPAPVTADLQHENVFGLRWLRELVYSVSACTLDAPHLQPVLTDVVQYAAITGVRNLRLVVPDHVPASADIVLDKVWRLKTAGILHMPRSLIHETTEALADMEAALPGASHG